MWGSDGSWPVCGLTFVFRLPVSPLRGMARSELWQAALVLTVYLQNLVGPTVSAGVTRAGIHHRFPEPFVQEDGDTFLARVMQGLRQGIVEQIRSVVGD